jgi:hypothetical protein
MNKRIIKLRTPQIKVNIWGTLKIKNKKVTETYYLLKETLHTI